MMKLSEELKINELEEAMRVVLRFGGKIKRDGYTVYQVKDRLRIDLVIEEDENELA